MDMDFVERGTETIHTSITQIDHCSTTTTRITYRQQLSIHHIESNGFARRLSLCICNNTIYIYIYCLNVVVSIVTTIYTSDLLINIFRSLIFIASNIVRRWKIIGDDDVRRHTHTPNKRHRKINCRAAFRVWCVRTPFWVAAHGRIRT